MPKIRGKKKISKARRQRLNRTLRLDPSRTLTLRNAFARELVKRFRKLKGAIVKLIAVDDVFGMIADRKAGARKMNTNAQNAFCPTGPGGGVDPSCSPGGTSAPKDMRSEITREESSQLERTLRESGGFTYQPISNTSPKEGFAVATFRQAEKVFDEDKLTVDDIYNYLTEHADKFSDERVHIGGWKDQGKVYLDLSSVVQDRAEALELGSKHDQLAVFDLKNFQTIDVPKGRREREQQHQSTPSTNTRQTGRYATTKSDNRYPIVPRVNGPRTYRTGNRRATAQSRFATVTQRLTTNAPKGAWRFKSSPEKVEEFMKWLRKQMRQTILGQMEAALLRRYVEQAMRRGAGRSYDDVRRNPNFDNESMRDIYIGGREEFLRNAFRQPESVEKIKILASRVFTDLEGITDQTATVIHRTLIDGLARGQHPNDIAEDIAADVDDIGIGRARTIARTEIIRAHAEGQLVALEGLGVESIGVMVEWSTAGDEHVCPACEPLEGAVFTIEEAHGMIPRHPNCRCSFIPANVGEDTEDQIRTRGDLNEAIEESQELADPDWGPSVDISRPRPKSIFNRRIDPIAAFSQMLINVFCPTGK